jgi:translation initiation factor 5A
MSTSKTGKHGHAKVHMIGLDIFNNRKYEDICPSTHNMDVPNVSRKDFQLLDVSDDGFLSLMDDAGVTRDDLKVPDGEIGLEIRSSIEEGKDILVRQQKYTKIEHAIVYCSVGKQLDGGIVSEERRAGFR